VGLLQLIQNVIVLFVIVNLFAELLASLVKLLFHVEHLHLHVSHFCLVILFNLHFFFLHLALEVFKLSLGLFPL
jgi:hypothetical protein